MRKSRFNEEQIVAVLKEADAGAQLVDSVLKDRLIEIRYIPFV